jgi:uncharacterized protein (DUF1697 family)
VKNTKKTSHDSPAPKKYVAFLRGINVGGRIIKNVDLKDCFEMMKFDDVSILLQSGNVIFASEEKDIGRLRSKIEQGLEKRFKYPAKAVVKDLSTVKRIVDNYPFDQGESENQYYIVFLRENVGKEMLRDAVIDDRVEQIATGTQVIYWKVRKGTTLDSGFGKFLSKTPYKEQTTTRNINTLLKLFR